MGNVSGCAFGGEPFAFWLVSLAVWIGVTAIGQIVVASCARMIAERDADEADEADEADAGTANVYQHPAVDDPPPVAYPRLLRVSA